MPTFGIDLGTTNSCGFLCGHNEIPVLVFLQNQRTMPSAVACTERGLICGSPALTLIDDDPRQAPTVAREFKRLIGRPFSEIDLNDFRSFPFTVQKDPSSELAVVNLNNELFTAHTLSAEILKRIKTYAQNQFGLDPDQIDTVVTVPAYFNDSQKLASRRAGILAGLNVIRVLEKPIAAALAFFHANPDLDVVGKLFLVFDLGGSTFDITIIKADEQQSHVVIDTDGDANLGGSNFDDLLYQDCVMKAVDQFGPNIRNNIYLTTALRKKCVLGKEQLSFQESVDIDLKVGQHHFVHVVRRADFEEICSDMFTQCIAQVEQLLSRNYLTVEDIQQVLLVGGSTRIPKIRRMLHQMFGLQKVDGSLEVDEIVARGASLLGYCC
ncbi:hypothetical protein GEMRC1_000517 [Eukaryota sp. GEM-RC1]